MSWVPSVVRPLIRWGARLAAAKKFKKVVKSLTKKRLPTKGMMAAKKLIKRHVKKKSTVNVGPMAQGFARRPYRRRRYVRRRYVKKTVNKIHTFIRWCDKDTTYGEKGPNTILSSATDQHLTYQFKLDNLSAVSDFINLYDAYKINKIQLMLEPIFDQAANVPTQITFNRKMLVVHDYNDATPLTDEDEYLQYGNCKRYPLFSRRGIRITLYPKLNNVIENVGGAASGFTSLNSNRQFLNIATDEVPHFGIKIMIPGDTQYPLATTMFRVRAKFWLSMRGTK